MASAQSALGSGGEAPSVVQGQSPWWGGSGGEAPWSWNTFCFWTFNGSRKFAQFLLDNGKKRTFSYKVACKKFSWLDQGGHRTVPLPPKYATVDCNRLSFALLGSMISPYGSVRFYFILLHAVQWFPS